MPTDRRLRLGRRVASLALSLGLATGALSMACASSTERGAGPASPGASGVTVEDVVRLELERAAPRAFEDALAPDVPAAVRTRAALALARLEHRTAAPLLFRAAKDEAVAVRRHAAFGLGQLDLGLVAGRDLHDEVRRGIETFLTGWYGREASAPVRAAIVRALGRVSTGEGLAFLKSLAEAEGPHRADALYALGVSGARRSSSLSSDPALRAIVAAALDDGAVEVRRAAAYAAFRQKLPLDERQLARAKGERDAPTRIHLARAMQDALTDPAPALPLLEDADWRVRVEAIRALLAVGKRGGELPVGALREAGEAAARRLVQKGGVSAEAHVVMATCEALGARALPISPDELRPAALALVGVLSSAAPDVAPKLDAVRCRCAVAADALASRPELVRTCASSWGAEQVRRLEVEVATKARVSSRERVAWLARALADTAVPVRLQAAFALLEDGSPHAAELARSRLSAEEDPAVAGALLMLFTGERASDLDDATLARVVDRFYGATTLEEQEPLLQAAALLRGRDGASASAVADRLRMHPEPRLRELVDDVPHGERESGPRARVVAPPPAADLPAGVVLHTERGAVHLALDRDGAPVTVANFVTLARAGFYDGVVFHRVVSDFVTQGGDPRGDGSGGPGHTIPCENSDEAYERGAVGMALAGKDTGGSQFFITHSPQPHLDGGYTVFGRVAEGMDIADAIAQDDAILAIEVMP